MGVLENINIHDGSGNTLTSTSNALDVNVKSGNVTVFQPTGVDLHTVVDSGTITSITDPVTVNLRDAVGNNLTSTGGALDGNLKAIGGYDVVTGPGASGSGIPRVTVANDSKVQPWDGINSAKFDATGETTVDITRFGGTAMQIGQTVMAHSIPVVIASDQQIAVSGVFNTQGGTTNSGTVPNTLDGTLAIVNDDFVWSTLVLNFVLSLGEVLSLGGEFQVEGSVDGNTWTAITGTLLSTTPEQITQYTTTGFGTCTSRYNIAGFPWIRLRTTNPFTGTITVQQALTTALGDEVSFTTSRIVDAAGNSVDLTPPAQYTDGQSPQPAYFQGGLDILPTFAATQVVNAADAAFVLPKRSQIGNTLVVAAVIQGTNLTAANLAPMWLADTAGSTYTLAQLYDSTVTSAGQAIAIYVKTITAVDNEGQIGLILGYNGTIGTGQPITSITSIALLAHEYSGVTVTGDAIAHVLTPSSATGPTSAPIAPGAGYLVYNLISGQEPNTQLSDVLTINAGGHLTSGFVQVLSSDPVQACTGDNLSTYELLGMAWDWVCVKLPVATTGQVMMGRLLSADGPIIQAIQIDASDGGVLSHITNSDPLSPLFVSVTGPVDISTTGTNFPVQLQDGQSEPLSSTSGSLNVNITNGPLPVTQSGMWTVTADNGSSGPPGGSPPAKTTVVGGIKNGTAIEFLQLDANNNLMVNVAAGISNPAASATGSDVPADASYTGLNIGGNLVGQSGFSLTNAKAAAVAIVDSNGNQIGGTGGSLNVNVTNPGSQQNPAATPVGLTVPEYASYTGFNSGGDLVGVSATNPLPVAFGSTPAVTISGTPAVTVTGTVTSKTQDGAGNNLTSTSGSLNVNVTGGSASGTQYANATAVAIPTGTVAMGTDGTDVRAFSTTSTGALNVVSAPVAITGASGAAVEAAQGTTAPAHVIQVGGVYNSTAPNISSGDITALRTDGVGNLKVSLAGVSVTPAVNIQSNGSTLTNTGGSLNVNLQSSGTNLTNTSGALNVNVTNSPSGSNAAASATGSAVPSQASYTGINTNGTLTGLMGFTDQGAAGGTATQNGTMGMMLQQSGGNYAWAQRCDSNGSHIVTHAPSTFAVCALSSTFINNTGAAVTVKASAGNLYGFSLTNSTAAPAYVEFFNTTTTPTLGTTGVVFCVVIPASGNVTINPTAMGLMNFSSGIGFAVTTAENGTTTAAVTGMIFYK
jgi:hypothetical protein